MGKLKDLTGMRFDRLLVIERDNRNGNQAYWKCKCDCGNNTVVASQKLISGSTKSCGCKRKEQNKQRNEERQYNLSGQKIGNVTVIKKDEKGKRSSWLCECCCGKIISVNTYSLISGRTKSCGCQKKVRNKERVISCDYVVSNNIVTVTLRSGQEMICDFEDWLRLKEYGWRLGDTGYAQTRVDGKNIKFHIEVMGKKKGLVIDHINRNRLDNRKENLRFVTQEVNTLNRSMQSNNKCGEKGVYYDKSRNKYVAEIKVRKKKIHLGRFDTIEEAVSEREKAVEKYHAPIIESKTK